MKSNRKPTSLINRAQTMLARLGSRALAVLAGVAVLILLPAAVAKADLAEIMDIRFGVNDDGITRMVIDMTAGASYRVVPVMIDGKPAMDIDIAAKAVTIPTAMVVGTETVGAGQGVGLADSFSYKMIAGAQPRLQMRQLLSETAVPSTVFILKPKGSVTHYRLVIDLKAATKNQFDANINKAFGILPALSTTSSLNVAQTPPSPVIVEKGQEAPFGTTSDQTRSAALEIAQQIEAISGKPPIPRIKPKSEVSGKFTVVIDAGHGGKDPGAIGPSGNYEKTVTLTAAKELRDILVKRGYNVILTRDEDKYLDADKKKDLDKRIAVARQNGANLFLSIHADAHDDDTVRGASVYTLSDKGSDRLMRQASLDGNFAVSGKDFKDYDETVGYIAMDMVATRTRDVSGRFANLLIDALKSEVTMVNNTHREASYAVLLSADIPAILLELGFISNASDEKNLTSKTWRKKTLSAVADSIDTYVEEQKPLKEAHNISAGQ